MNPSTSSPSAPDTLDDAPALDDAMNLRRATLEVIRLNGELRREAEHRRRQAVQLARHGAQTQRDLRAAAEVQKGLLPRPGDPDPRCASRWWFSPCATVSGDVFNVLPLGPGLLAAYILDVSGHGVASALVAASAAQSLLHACRAGAPDPAAVLEALDREFPLERFDRYFSLCFVVLDLEAGTLRYCNAGHPPPALIRAQGRVLLLDRGGPVVGLGGALPFEATTLALRPGDLLVLYTDGLTGLRDARGDMYGTDRLDGVLAGLAGLDAAQALGALRRDAEAFADAATPRDDLSVLVLALPPAPGTGEAAP